MRETLLLLAQSTEAEYPIRHTEKGEPYRPYSRRECDYDHSLLRGPPSASVSEDQRNGAQRSTYLHSGPRPQLRLIASREINTNARSPPSDVPYAAPKQYLPLNVRLPAGRQDHPFRLTERLRCDSNCQHDRAPTQSDDPPHGDSHLDAKLCSPDARATRCPV